MALHYPERNEEKRRPGDATKRVVVFLFGAFFAVFGVTAAFGNAWVGAALFGAVAWIFFAIAWRGRRQTVEQARDLSSITEDLAHLP